MDSFQELKDKYNYHSQKQIERTKKATRTTKLSEIAQGSNVKLLALQKALKTKMDEKKKERYEKRLLAYQIANEELEADYEKFFDENESENEFNENEEQETNDNEEQEVNDEDEMDEELDEEKISSQENQNEQSDVEKSLNEDSNQNSNDSENSPMDCTSSNLIESNRELINLLNCQKSQQLDNEDLLGLCSAKVDAPNDFIDDECEDDDDNHSSSDEKSNDSDDEESFINEDELSESPDQLNEENENESLNLNEKPNKKKQFDSDSDDEDLDFVNQFKFKNKLNSEESNDSQFENKRESTFLESKSKSNFKDARFNLKDFIEDQAELSEEDKDKVSSDEEENSDDEYEEDEIDENLPSEEEILKANNKMFLKQQMDEDKRRILEYQERFLEHGDLHEDGDARQRKFKWKNVDNVWIDNVRDSSDSDEFDIADSQITYTSLHLKQLDGLNKNKANGDEQSQSGATPSQSNLSKDEKRKKKLMNTSLNKTHLNSYSTFDNNIFNKHMRTFKRTMVNGPKNDIQSYIIKDKNLVEAMSIKSSVVIGNQAKARQSYRNDYGTSNAKKRKTDKNENKKSIFDLF